MWSSEKHRLGFRDCSPLGYGFIQAAFVLFWCGVISVFVIALLALRTVMTSGFSVRLLAAGALPLVLFIVAWMLNRAAWLLVSRKGFVYDYAKDTCTWRKP